MFLLRLSVCLAVSPSVISLRLSGLKFEGDLLSVCVARTPIALAALSDSEAPEGLLRSLKMSLASKAAFHTSLVIRTSGPRPVSLVESYFDPDGVHVDRLIYRSSTAPLPSHTQFAPVTPVLENCLDVFFPQSFRREILSSEFFVPDHNSRHPFREIGKLFRPNSYDVLRKNCNSFTLLAYKWLTGRELRDNNIRRAENAVLALLKLQQKLIKGLSWGGETGTEIRVQGRSLSRPDKRLQGVDFDRTCQSAASSLCLTDHPRVDEHEVSFDSKKDSAFLAFYHPVCATSCEEEDSNSVGDDENPKVTGVDCRETITCISPSSSERGLETQQHEKESEEADESEGCWLESLGIDYKPTEEAKRWNLEEALEGIIPLGLVQEPKITGLKKEGYNLISGECVIG